MLALLAACVVRICTFAAKRRGTLKVGPYDIRVLTAADGGTEVAVKDGSGVVGEAVVAWIVQTAVAGYSRARADAIREAWPDPGRRSTVCEI